MIRKFFGDGERDFALPMTMIHELERKRDAAFGTLLSRVRTGQFHFDDLAETIRLALIGGGTPAQEAAALVEAYVAAEGNALIEAQILATDILLDRYAGKEPAEQDSTDE
ncbi:MAG: gene transfer agent family protein [Vicinamibacterales bacterium]